MGLRRTSSADLGTVQRDFSLLLGLVRAPRETLEEVVQPYIEMHVDKQFRTAGRHGGKRWSFGGEPVYEAAKTARYGARYGKRPLFVPRKVEQLRPSLVMSGHPQAIRRIERGRLTIGTKIRYADRLINTGGVGPYGERYPARDPFQLKARQRLELEKEIARDLVKRARRRIRGGEA